MRGLELKVPPVAVTLIAAGLMWAAARWLAFAAFAMPGRLPVAVCLAAAGGAIALLGVASFRRAKTTTNPLKPQTASALVSSGMYRYSRNPMYVGFLLFLLAWLVYLSNPVAAVLIPGYVVYMNRFQIIPEERFLESLFGQAYADYRNQVRRWI